MIYSNSVSSRMFAFCVSFTLILSAFTVSAQSLLYKISGNGMANPVYLYGTIHALPQSDFFIDDIVLQKFDLANKVVFEIDMSSPTMIHEVQMSMLMTENNIEQLLSDSDFTALRNFFIDSLQLPFDFFKQVKPLMLASFMLPQIVGDQPASYEGFFLQKAMEFQKPMAGLETVAEQMKYLDKVPLADQAKMLMETVYDFDNSRKEFRYLVETYKTRNVEEVYRAVVQASDQYGEFGEYLIDARNINWIPRIVELGNQQVTFIAVGCGHLGGVNGVLNLFRVNGYDVVEVNGETK